MRLLRGAVPVVLEPGYRFEIGKARLLRDGTDVGIVSTGFMTERALDAADTLRNQGVSVGVLHVPTIKPFDADAVAGFAAGVRHVVTAENHVVVGGLASLVVEALFDRGIARNVTRIGLPDRYIECGAVPTLQAKYGLTTEAMIQTITRSGTAT
jgi:transketolase